MKLISLKNLIATAFIASSISFSHASEKLIENFPVEQGKPYQVKNIATKGNIDAFLVNPNSVIQQKNSFVLTDNYGHKVFYEDGKYYGEQLIVNWEKMRDFIYAAARFDNNELLIFAKRYLRPEKMSIEEFLKRPGNAYAHEIVSETDGKTGWNTYKSTIYGAGYLNFKGIIGNKAYIKSSVNKPYLGKVLGFAMDKISNVFLPPGRNLKKEDISFETQLFFAAGGRFKSDEKIYYRLINSLNFPEYSFNKDLILKLNPRSQRELPYLGNFDYVLFYKKDPLTDELRVFWVISGTRTGFDFNNNYILKDRVVTVPYLKSMGLNLNKDIDRELDLVSKEQILLLDSNSTNIVDTFGRKEIM